MFFGGAVGDENVTAAGRARIYDLRSTFISNALANSLTVFETARIAGTSVKMIELHYGVDRYREGVVAGTARGVKGTARWRGC